MEPLHETVRAQHQPEASVAPRALSETQNSEADRRETEEAVLALQPYLTVEQEELETGPAVS